MRGSSWVPLSLVLGMLAASGCGSSDGEQPTDNGGLAGSGSGGDGDGSGGQDSNGGSGGDGGQGGVPIAESGGQSSGTGGSMGGAEGLGSSEFCDEYAGAYCDWFERCQSGSCETWPGYQLAVRECEDALASVDLGFLAFQSDVAGACVEVAAAMECGQGPPFNSAEVRQACDGVFQGTVALEGECTVAEFAGLFDECAEGFCVRPEAPIGLECLGQCVAFKGDGDPCEAVDRCDDGLYCIDGECSPPRELGEECENAVCEPGLTCAWESPTTCRAPAPAGSDCVDDFDCMAPAVCIAESCVVDVAEGAHCRSSETCEDGLYCRTEEQECAQPVPLGATCDGSFDECEVGSTCSSAEPFTCVVALGAESEICGPWGCEEGLWCDTSATEAGVCLVRLGEGDDCPADGSCEPGFLCMGDGKCHPPGDADEPCSLTFSGTCLADLFCDRETGLCKAPRDEGETCNPIVPVDSCQPGLYCACLSPSCPSTSTGHNVEDVCVPQQADGESCAADQECESGYCLGEPSECVPAPADNCSR
jgi:hypothetical protein